MKPNTSASWPARALALAWLMLAAACASMPTSQTSALNARIGSRPAAHTAGVITAAELQSVSARSTFDAVRQLHPEFLRASLRATSSYESAAPSVYVDRTYLGDVSVLRLIAIEEIRDISFLHPTEAHFRFGTTCPCGGGVIVVQTETARAP